VTLSSMKNTQIIHVPTCNPSFDHHFTARDNRSGSTIDYGDSRCTPEACDELPVSRDLSALPFLLLLHNIINNNRTTQLAV
jgi:hypothetical protein